MTVILPTTVRLVLSNMLKNKIVLQVHIVPNLISRNLSCMIELTVFIQTMQYPHIQKVCQPLQIKEICVKNSQSLW